MKPVAATMLALDRGLWGSSAQGKKREESGLLFGGATCVCNAGLQVSAVLQPFRSQRHLMNVRNNTCTDATLTYMFKFGTSESVAAEAKPVVRFGCW